MTDARAAEPRVEPRPRGAAVDLLVIGGGIYGATAAYEAARRGLSVLLVEREDFAAGTSSSSMKIAHGGLRYLQALDLPRSFESIAERRRLLTIAPHLVRPLRCRVEVRGRSLGYRLQLRAGLALNEVLSWRRNRGVPPGSELPRAPFPDWYDARIEDTERLLLSFLHTAVALGEGRVRVRNYTQVERFVRRDGRIVAARIPGEGEVAAGCVLSCTGAAEAERAILSMNAVVDALPFVPADTALALTHPHDRRNVFVVPWRGRHILGTWDREYPDDPAAPLRVEAAWVDEFLAWLAPVHPGLRLARADVRFLHAGLVPRDAQRAAPAGHFRIHEEADGRIRVEGVKWTTARGVASRAVARAARRLGRGRRVSDDDLPPLLDPREVLARYVAARPEAAQALLPDHPLTVGAVRFALEEEQARSLADVLLRRTGAATAGHPGAALVAAVADLLARELGWSPAERQAQIEAFEADFRLGGGWRSPRFGAAPAHRRPGSVF